MTAKREKQEEDVSSHRRSQHTLFDDRFSQMLPGDIWAHLAAQQIDPVLWATGGEFGYEDGFELFEDVGHLYELQLARLEFATIGDDKELFRRRAAYFKRVAGKLTDHVAFSSVKGKGQIGHSNQYLTHWFYPYKGKFHGQMVRALINFAGAREGDIVLDPFGGSGTTAVESALAGCDSVLVDINPALCTIAYIKHKCIFLPIDEVEQCVKLAYAPKYFQEFTSILGRKTKRFKIEGEHTSEQILSDFWEEFPSGIVKAMPYEVRNFLLLVFLHALSDKTYLCQTKKDKPLFEFFVQNLKDYIATIRGTNEVVRRCGIRRRKADVLCCSALNLPLEDGTVSCIVTSPPYSIAIDYVRNDLHMLEYLGVDASLLREHMVGLRGGGRKLVMYEDDMHRSLQEMARVVRDGGWVFIVLGDVVVNGKRTNFAQKILQWAPSVGFKEGFLIKRPILGGYARLRYEQIIFLRR